MDKLTREHAIKVLSDLMSPIAPFLNNEGVQEVMVNGPDDVWVEERGVLSRLEIKLSDIEIRSAIEILARLVGKEAKETNRDAIIDARLEGLRIAAALSPVATKGASICIRKHAQNLRTLQDYVDDGSFSAEVRDLLTQAVLNRKNILISGGTSSGKTTFMNAILAIIPDQERVVTIEDTKELQVKVPNHVSFESNEQAGITIRDLVRLSLRYRPDRIIVGEVRGAEAFDLMQAMNTGHDGGFATIHANSASAALSRLESLVLTTPGVDWPLEAIRVQIATTFHYVIQLVRINGRRQLKEVLEINGFDNERRTYVTKSLN